MNEAQAGRLQRPTWGWTSTLVALVDVALVVMLAAFDVYALRNMSGHTGLPVSWLKWLYLLVALVGLGLVRVSRRRTVKPLVAWAFLCIGLAGFVNGFLLERLGIITPYDEWVRRLGEPGPR